MVESRRTSFLNWLCDRVVCAANARMVVVMVLFLPLSVWQGEVGGGGVL